VSDLIKLRVVSSDPPRVEFDAYSPDAYANSDDPWRSFLIDVVEACGMVIEAAASRRIRPGDATILLTPVKFVRGG
jgi:hypothetical protein